MFHSPLHIISQCPIPHCLSSSTVPFLFVYHPSYSIPYYLSSPIVYHSTIFSFPIIYHFPLSIIPNYISSPMAPLSIIPHCPIVYHPPLPHSTLFIISVVYDFQLYFIGDNVPRSGLPCGPMFHDGDQTPSIHKT